MSLRLRLTIVCGLVLALLGIVVPILAQQSGTKTTADADLSSRVSAYRPATPEPGSLSLSGGAVVPTHPLLAVLKYARQEQEYLRRTVRDFTCRLVKRERIDGFLQDYHYIDMRVREEVREENRMMVPLSIWMHFLGPAKVAGRRVIYVEGRNNGKLLVRNGGKHFDYVVVQVDPDGENARRETLVPITQTGFNHVLPQMIQVLERHLAADPSGANTRVSRIAGAKINKRDCALLRIVHPERENGLEFHTVNVYIDQQLHVPVRVEYFDWPKREGQPQPLIAEYTYTDLQLNVGLTDDAFDPALLRGGR